MAFPHLCRFTGGYGKTQKFSANCQHGSPQEARESLKRDVQQVPVSSALWIRVDLGHLGSTQGESRHGTEKTIRFKERSVEFRPIAMWNWVVWKFGSRNLNGWADSCRDKPFVAPCGTAFLGWGLGRWQEMTTAWNAVHRFQDNQKQLGRQQVRSSSKQRMAGYLWTTCWSLQVCYQFPQTSPFWREDHDTALDGMG